MLVCAAHAAGHHPRLAPGAHQPEKTASDAITGFPGAAGVVEGRARVIFTPEEGDQLQAVEILVTTVANIGWTPLSHASSVSPPWSAVSMRPCACTTATCAGQRRAGHGGAAAGGGSPYPGSHCRGSGHPYEFCASRPGSYATGDILAVLFA